MPTYEYACKSCGEHLEVVQSFRDEPLTECHLCGGQLRKVFSPVGISFKGSGFYRNDSRSPSKTGARDGHDKSETSTDSSTKGTGTDAGKTDTGKTDTGKTDTGKSDTGKKAATSEAKTA